MKTYCCAGTTKCSRKYFYWNQKVWLIVPHHAIQNIRQDQRFEGNCNRWAIIYIHIILTELGRPTRRLKDDIKMSVKNT
jgi:hypothetical protein